MARKAVIFGAGKIGRGFLAQLATESGYEAVFVDVDGDLVDRLNKSGRYTVKIVGQHPKDAEVANVRAVHGGSDVR